MRRTGFVCSLFVLGAVASACANGDPRSEESNSRQPRPAIATLPLRDYNGFGPPPFHAVQSSGTFAGACAGISTRPQIDDYCWPIQNAGVFPSEEQGNPGTYDCYCSGGSDPCGSAGCNNPAPACKCPNNGVCGLTGNCMPGGPVDAGMDAGCSTTPTYPPPTSTDSLRISVGYDVPEPAASWACGQLSAIPYLGQALFSPTGGIGFTADAQQTSSTEWKDTCREESSETLGLGIMVNICSLEAAGQVQKTKTDAKQHCVNCDPPPATCGDVACTEDIDDLTRQATVSRTLGIPLGGSSCGGSAPSSRWIDWIKRNVNVSVTLGAGWNGKSTTTERAKGAATCAQACTDCLTQLDRNSLFLQATGRASVSTPTWGGVSGSAFVSLTGRVGAGREDQSSTCTPTCGGFDANASITLRIGVSAGAFGYRIARSVGYTCQWRNSWSTCPGANAANTSECRWSNPTDP